MEYKGHWSGAETKFLISLWREDSIFKEISSVSVRNKTVYAELQKRMAAAGFERSPDQIKNKMKTLKAAYRKVVDSNRRSGRAKITCPFFEELDEFLGHRPAVNPPPGSVRETGASPSAATSVASGASSPRPAVDTLDGADASSNVTSKDGNWSDSLSDAEMESQETVHQEDSGHALDDVPSDDSQAQPNDEPQIGLAQPQVVEAGDHSENRRRKRTRRDRSVKEQLEKILRVSRERDRTFLEAERARREEEAQLRREEMQLMRDLIQSDREERERRERRQNQQFEMMMAVLQSQSRWHQHTPQYSQPERGEFMYQLHSRDFTSQ